MYNSYRECPQCGEAIEGRPNKKFCNEACKGKHFRENSSALPDAGIDGPDYQRPVEPRHSNYPRVVELQRTWNEEEDDGEEIQANKERAARLHEQFQKLVREFLGVEGQLMKLRGTKDLLRQVDNLIEYYQGHPYLKASGNLVSRRLRALYSINDVLQEVKQDIDAKVL